MKHLFSTWNLRNLSIKNRVVMAPMVQYVAQEGFANDWHFLHYPTRAVGGVGLIIVESTAVLPAGRISEQDLGLWQDEHIAGLARIVKSCHLHGARVGIQINHAGRKHMGKATELIAPSPIAFSADYRTPRKMNEADIEAVVRAFSEAAQRAVRAGFDMIEIHGAHGYLIHQFLSPLTNVRTDIYGQDKSLFLKKILLAVRAQIPDEMPLSLRVSASDHKTGGVDVPYMTKLLKPLTGLFDVLHVSSGGLAEDARIYAYPFYQIDYARLLKSALALPVIGGGLIRDAIGANEIVQSGAVDAVFLARELLRNPYWALQASMQLESEKATLPTPYERARI